MVGRLVKKQQVRAGKEHPRKLRLVAFAAAHDGKRFAQFLLRETEAEERRARAAAEGQPAAVLIAFAQGMLPADERIQFVFLRMLQRSVHLLHRRLKLHQRRKHGKRRVIHALLRILNALRHGYHAHAAVFVNAPLIGLLLPEQDAEQGGFSAPVHADKANFILFVDLKRHIRKEQPLNEGLFEMMCRQNRHEFLLLSMPKKREPRPFGNSIVFYILSYAARASLPAACSIQYRLRTFSAKPRKSWSSRAVPSSSTAFPLKRPNT